MTRIIIGLPARVVRLILSFVCAMMKAQEAHGDYDKTSPRQAKSAVADDRTRNSKLFKKLGDAELFFPTVLKRVENLADYLDKVTPTVDKCVDPESMWARLIFFRKAVTHKKKARYLQIRS